MERVGIRFPASRVTPPSVVLLSQVFYQGWVLLTNLTILTVRWSVSPHQLLHWLITKGEGNIGKLLFLSHCVIKPDSVSGNSWGWNRTTLDNRSTWVNWEFPVTSPTQPHPSDEYDCLPVATSTPHHLWVWVSSVKAVHLLHHLTLLFLQGVPYGLLHQLRIELVFSPAPLDIRTEWPKDQEHLYLVAAYWNNIIIAITLH